MKHLCILGSIIPALVLLTSLNVGQPKQDKATVDIITVDGFGRYLGEAKVDSFKSMDSGQDFSTHFRESAAKDIPYGVYQVRVHRPAYFSSQVTAQVFQPVVWVVVGLRYGEELPIYPAPRLRLTGTVKNIPPGEKPIYMRLAAVYSNFIMDTIADVGNPPGAFTLAGVIPDGQYILLTIGRTGILDMRELILEFPAKEPIVIDLKPAAGKKDR